jgi:hypothetical protein
LNDNNYSVYIHPDVAQVRALHAAIVASFDFSGSILELLEKMAGNLVEANKAGDPRSHVEIKNYMRTGDLNRKDNSLQIDLRMARELMARQYGFADWEEVKYGGRVSLQAEFEKAVDLLVMGKLDDMKQILEKNPHLILQRSAFYHKASLLHYAAANGVEIRRQVVPANLAEMVRILISRGADREAKGYFYGSMMNTMALLRTGTHTREAGIYQSIHNLLV